MNIVVIGLGSIGKKHVDALYAIHVTATIYALRSTSTVEKYRDVINIQSLAEIPGKIDFAIISNVTSAHGATLKEITEYCCHVFIEKPVLSDVSAAGQISGLLRSKGIISYIACNLRFHPALVFIKNYIDDKKVRINEVNIYCGSYLPDWRPGINFRESYSANAEMGGGAHLDLIHEIDYCTWLFGFPVSVVVSKKKNSSLDINAVDSAMFLLEYPHFTAGIVLNYYRRDLKRTLEIVTSDDTILIDLVNSTVKLQQSGEFLFNHSFNMRETYQLQMKYFLNMVHTGSMPENNFDYAVEVLKLANA